MKISKGMSQQIETLRAEAEAAVEQLQELFSALQDEKQDVFDNRSEKWQESEKGEAMQEEIDTLGNIVDGLSDALEAVQQAEIPEA